MSERCRRASTSFTSRLLKKLAEEALVFFVVR
jgi:hypothetical protein